MALLRVAGSSYRFPTVSSHFRRVAVLSSMRAFFAVALVALQKSLTHSFSPVNLPRRVKTGIQHDRLRERIKLDGIPKLFRWLTDQYPSVNQRISEGLGANSDDIDNLYLDMNGIIHMSVKI